MLHAFRKRSTLGVSMRGSGSRTRAVLLVVAIMGFQAVLGAPAAHAEECGEAPNPERPGSGMVGAIDPAEGQGEAGSAYVDYSYAGLVWHVYETDCGPLSGITDPSTTLDTWAGNQLFNLAKNIVGATNALHYTVMEGGLFSPLYDAIRSGTEMVYNNIYAQLFGLVALLLAILMFRHIWRGDLPSVSKRALFALGGLWLAASSFAMLRYFDHIDRAIVQTTTNIQAGFVDADEDRVVRHILPTTLHNEIVYTNWLRGQFGSPDAPQAEKYGMDLLDAQAFTWEQIRNGDDADQAVVDGKKAEYKRIAGEQGTATGYFTGEDGSRTGAGFLAFLQSIIYSLFQLLAKASVLLAQVLVRLLTLTAPLIGLVALLHHDILRKVARVAGAVAFNLVVLSLLAGVHALLLQA
ncbi:MAG: magnesium transporter, partial [Haloechinothrix sp.]